MKIEKLIALIEDELTINIHQLKHLQFEKINGEHVISLVDTSGAAKSGGIYDFAFAVIDTSNATAYEKYMFENYYDIGTGCDSIVNLILTNIPIVETSIEDTIPCNGMYLFAGDTLTDLLSPYVYHFTGQNGCDSIVNLTLLPNNITT